MRHYHSHDDAFIFVLEGEVVLCTDDFTTPACLCRWPLTSFIPAAQS